LAIIFLLVAFRRHVLAKVALRIHESHGDQWQSAV